MGWRNPCCGTSHPAEMPEALGRGMHERFVLPHGARCFPRRRGSDTLTYWLPPVPAKGMAGHQIVYRPLAGGKIACTSPSPASTVRAGGRVNERQNRARSCPHQTTSTLSVRGYAIGRWPRFKPWQGGSEDSRAVFRLRGAAPNLRAVRGSRRTGHGGGGSRLPAWVFLAATPPFS